MTPAPVVPKHASRRLRFILLIGIVLIAGELCAAAEPSTQGRETETIPASSQP